MERRFSMKDFEQTLKGHADEFKMVPSKRVWHGIYNDLHPGRRWPSVSMSLLLIFTLLVVGHLNTHTGTKHSNSKNVSVNSKNVVSNFQPQKISNIAKKTGQQKNASARLNVIASVAPPSYNIKPKIKTIINNYLLNNNLMNGDLLANNIQLTAQPGSAQFEESNIIFPQMNANSPGNKDNFLNDLDISSIDNSPKVYEIINGNIALIDTYNLKPDESNTIGNSNLKYTKFISINNNDNEISKNKSGEGNKKLSKPKRKKDAKLSWTYFVAPQLNSVIFNGNPIRPINAINSPALAINQKSYRVLNNPAPGFEAGTQMNYTLSEKINFTWGVHITYAGYNIISNEVHPTFANLFLKDPGTGNIYSKSYITHYGDGTGQTIVSIPNYNLQASMPVGLQYQFLGNNKVQFSTAADFEPSFVIKSNAYLLSSDGNNYVNDPDLLRKINMSSNFGAFATFISSKFKWQIGPNVRYQWLSTYKKDYPVQEHLIDYGIRIGISPIRK